MTNIILKNKAIILRQDGHTYGEIKKELGLAKSTLSNWLSTIALTKMQIDLLNQNKIDKRQITAEKISLIKSQKRELKLSEYYDVEFRKFKKLGSRELYVAGLMLYWGEGTKGANCVVSLCNTDPQMLIFYRYWLENSLNIKPERIKVSLHLYQDMDIDNIKTYWSNILKIPINQFIKPYIKKINIVSLNQKGYGKGTCSLYLYDSSLKRKIMTGIKIVLNKATEGKI